MKPEKVSPFVLKIRTNPDLVSAVEVIKLRNIEEGSPPDEAERHATRLLNRITTLGQADAIIKAAERITQPSLKPQK